MGSLSRGTLGGGSDGAIGFQPFTGPGGRVRRAPAFSFRRGIPVPTLLRRVSRRGLLPGSLLSTLPAPVPHVCRPLGLFAGAGLAPRAAWVPRAPRGGVLRLPADVSRATCCRFDGFPNRWCESWSLRVTELSRVLATVLDHSWACRQVPGRKRPYGCPVVSRDSRKPR